MIAFVSLMIASHLLMAAVTENIDLVTKTSTLNGVSRSVDELHGDVLERRQMKEMMTEMMRMNLTQWNEKTLDACVSSLESMKGRVSNPSGMAVCYNLPYLDENAGVFEADLRLFMVAPPSGPFRTISTDKIDVGLSYSGATVSPVNASAIRRSESNSVFRLTSMNNVEDVKRDMTPKLMDTYNFVGQIDKSTLPLKTDALRKVLIPIVSLSAVDPTGATVKTSLSSDEISFVNGVFAKAKEYSPTKALLAQPIQTLVVAPEAPFVVPGLSILIFPIGLIITGFWTVAFIATIGYGTVGRIQYREQFRENKLREAKSSLSTI